MTAPLSLRDKQVAFLRGLYGPGLSYSDMLRQYYGAGTTKSVTDAANEFWSGSNSLADDMYGVLPGSGSLADKQYGSSSGGLVNTITNLVTTPKPTGNSWGSSNASSWLHTYNAGGWIDVDRQAGASANIAASPINCGIGSPSNPVLKAGVNYQRSIEIWVDAAATISSAGADTWVGGQVLVANQWTKITEQFIATGSAQYVTAFNIVMTGVGTGIHCRLRKSFLAENPSGRELAYADGNSPGWSWNGAANSSTSKGPALYEADQVTNQASNPAPASVTGWQSNNSGMWLHTYAAGEISVDRQAGATQAANAYSLGLPSPYNPACKVGVNYQRSVEIWVDATATVVNIGAGYAGGQVLAAGTWTKVTEQFIGTGTAQYVTGIGVNITGVGTGIHCKFRKSMLVENPSGKELAYADGNSPGWSWNGTANASTSKGPATYT